MEVTVKIPDQFVERLIPAGKDASRVLLEELVEGAYGDGRIDAEQMNEILGGGVKLDFNATSGPDEATDGSYRGEPVPEWINDPEQVRLHAAMEEFIGCLDAPDLPRSDRVRETVQESLREHYHRERRVG